VTPPANEPNTSATYKDIQRRTGLSLATISKYYNGGTVRPENAVAIQAAADALGFHINDFARSLRSGRSQTVGVLVPSLDNSFLLAVVAGVEQHLQKHGIGVLVGTSHSDVRGPGDAVDALLAKRVDGIVAVPTRPDIDALRRADERGVPVVTVDHTFPGLDSDHVQLDNIAAGAMAAYHLADHGHRQIAVIGGDGRIPSVGERRDGFVTALASRGIPLGADRLSENELHMEAGRQAMHRILNSSDRPTAVFAVNYDLSVGALIALNESGLTVPDDVSLLGFDLDVVARVTRPRTTTILQPMLTLGEKAADLMLDRIRGEAHAPCRFVTIAADLIAGESVRRIR
jgi:LacI family transcriptional regulator